MSQAGHRLSALAAWTAAALLTTFPPTAAGAATLFEDKSILPVVLEFPVRSLMRDKLEQAKVPATLHYSSPGASPTSLPLEVRPRGNTRLSICALPPLRLDFKRRQVAGTLFEGQRRLKLVTHCQVAVVSLVRYREYVWLEQAIYEAYRLITPLAFRTRRLTVNYVDTAERMGTVTGPAFLIEDVDELTARLGIRKVRRETLNAPDMDAAQTSLLELFQYMIGNTDWSARLPSDGETTCCHNGQVIEPANGAGGLVIVPYDFDQSGLINTEYSAVSPAVNVRHVWQRIYRGACERNAQVPASIARMRELRPQIEAVFQSEDLEERASRRALRYLQSFYEIIEDPAQVQRRIYDVCRSEA